MLAMLAPRWEQWCCPIIKRNGAPISRKNAGGGRSSFDKPCNFAVYRANKDVHLSLPTRKLAPPAIPLYLSIRLIFLNRVHTPFDPSPSSLHYSTISQIFRAIDRLIRNPRKSRASPARAAACKSAAKSASPGCGSAQELQQEAASRASRPGPLLAGKHDPKAACRSN